MEQLILLILSYQSSLNHGLRGLKRISWIIIRAILSNPIIRDTLWGDETFGRHALLSRGWGS